MRVAYFPNSCARNSQPVLSAILTSLQNRGHCVEENARDADAAVIWSMLWAGRMIPNQAVWNHYISTGRPVIMVDVGALYRGQTWKIALNSITADGYYGHQENLDWDRPQKLGISLAVNVTRNPRIVIATQHARSQQVAKLTSIESWVIDQITAVKQSSDRPITIRPHPRSRINSKKITQIFPDVFIEQPQRILDTYDSYNLTFDCHALINYNSGPGIQAALAGTRPLVDPSSLAYPVSIKFSDLDRPYNVDRDQWLTEICHTEYTLNEIEQGLWLQRLQSRLEKEI